MITKDKLRMAHASTLGTRKPPGPKERKKRERAKVGDNNGKATHSVVSAPPLINLDFFLQKSSFLCFETILRNCI